LALWFFFTGEISPKREIQKRSDFGGFQSPEVRKFRNKKGNNFQIHILFSFHCVAKGWFKICTSFLVYSQIWINLPRDDHHFGYKRDFLLPKKTLRRVRVEGLELIPSRQLQKNSRDPSRDK
jgi:hypothetical protein